VVVIYLCECFVVVIYLCVCLYVVFKILFGYALFLYVYIKSFCFLHVNQLNVPLGYVASGRCVSKLLYPFPHPSPPAAIMLGAISIDV